MARGVLVLAALTGWTCSLRRAPPMVQTETAPPPGGARAGAGAIESRLSASYRSVRLSSTNGDTSCLDLKGGTAVAKEVSDSDLREIEALIRRVDPLPIIWIRQKPV